VVYDFIKYLIIQTLRKLQSYFSLCWYCYLE